MIPRIKCLWAVDKIVATLDKDEFEFFLLVLLEEIYRAESDPRVYTVIKKMSAIKKFENAENDKFKEKQEWHLKNLNNTLANSS